MSADGSLPPGTRADHVTKRFGPDEYKCPQCGGWLGLERIKDDDGFTRQHLGCANCNWSDSEAE